MDFLPLLTNKCDVFATEVAFFSTNQVPDDPERVQVLATVRGERAAGQLMSLLQAADSIWESLPGIAKIVGPLRSMFRGWRSACSGLRGEGPKLEAEESFPTMLGLKIVSERGKVSRLWLRVPSLSVTLALIMKCCFCLTCPMLSGVDFSLIIMFLALSIVVFRLGICGINL